MGFIKEFFTFLFLSRNILCINSFWLNKFVDKRLHIVTNVERILKTSLTMEMRGKSVYTYKLRSSWWRKWEEYSASLKHLDYFQKPEVLCFGDGFMDVVATDKGAGQSAEQMLKERNWFRHPGGESFNVALALSKLGTPSTLAGAIGNDKDGRSLKAILRDARVGVEFLTFVSAPTRRVVVARDKNCEPVFSGFFKGLPSSEYADAKYCMDFESLERAVHQEYWSELKWIVTGTIGLAFPDTYRSHLELLRWAQKRGTPVLVDINWRPQFWNCSTNSGIETEARRRIQAYCSVADVMKLTLKEAAWLTCIDASEIVRDPGVLREVFPSCKGFLVTNGKETVAFDILGHQGCIEPPQVQFVDEIGAGDAFIAGFLHKFKNFDLHSSLDPRRRNTITEAVKFGCVTGALSTTAIGCIGAQPNPHQANQLFKKDPGQFRLQFAQTATAMSPHLDGDSFLFQEELPQIQNSSITHK